jgi:hypothetical protein
VEDAYEWRDLETGFLTDLDRDDVCLRVGGVDSAASFNYCRLPALVGQTRVTTNTLTCMIPIEFS